MKHEELLAKIYDLEYGTDYCPPALGNFALAVRAVVKLHEPIIHALPEETCWACQDLYPCPTIKAIERELA